MKKILIIMSAAVFLFSLFSFQLKNIRSSTDIMQVIPEGNNIEVSADAQAILDKSCLPCHGVDGIGKAKFKWNYTKMSKMKVSKLNSKMTKLIKEIEKEKMPTKKFLKKHPEAALSSNDKQILIDWAKSIKESNNE